ncbi:DNA-binding transcriptional LysR family regulator [Paraburkholderia sp. BL6669N2]|uniref:LysR family transcriptional regulator n=1 Tax=Paraburkholderia sp. BL6669N2 TaxID=1938807 RepID=UPI000E22743B|nr:LysR family transcriptional regulator [Paraburkholderia sp. BL6669N2]REG49113.1 DNA-binding transcriptional LysR family regulator [Paraburkholderia sp. BL6669N2]
MASIDLEWIAVFDEIYSTLSVTRAADKLGMTQGAASTALSRLRTYYSDPLFVRTSRGMLPTPRADELQPVLHQVRENLEMARTGSACFDPASAQRVFRLCMTDLGEISLLPRLLNYLQSRAPGIRIETEKINSDSPRRLEDAALDLAVGHMPQLEAGFYQQALFQQDFQCIVSVSHPRIGKRLSKAAYCEERHVEVSTHGTGHMAMLEAALTCAGIGRHVALRVPSFLAVAQIVAETELVATVPRYYALAMQSRESIRHMDVPYVLPAYTVHQYWHGRVHRDAGNVWLRKTIADLMPTAVIHPLASRR